MSTYEQALEVSRALCQEEGGRSLKFGMLELPHSARTDHFLVTGQPGSGKSGLLYMLMSSVIPYVGRDLRAIIFDGKWEHYDHIRQLNAACPIHVMHPFDKRAVAWDIAKDITTASGVRAFSQALIPDVSDGRDPMWNNAARNIISHILNRFIESAPNNWTLRDVVLAAKTADTLKNVLSNYSASEKAWAYLHNDTHRQNYWLTIQGFLEPLTEVAAIWHSCNHKLSLEDWTKDEAGSLIMMGSEPTRATTLDTLNRMLWGQLGRVLNNTSEDKETWIFLDDLCLAGLDDWELVNSGRPLNCVWAATLQSIIALRQLRGEKALKGIFSALQNKMFLATSDPETAQWASDFFGDNTILDEFVKMPSLWKSGQFASYNCIPCFGEAGRYSVSLSAEEFLRQIPNTHDAHEVHHLDEQILPDWTEEDYKRLRL